MEPGEIAGLLPEGPAAGMHGEIAAGVVTPADRDLMAGKKEQISLDLWFSYARERERRGEPIPNLNLHA